MTLVLVRLKQPPWGIPMKSVLTKTGSFDLFAYSLDFGPHSQTRLSRAVCTRSTYNYKSEIEIPAVLCGAGVVKRDLLDVNNVLSGADSPVRLVTQCNTVQQGGLNSPRRFALLRHCFVSAQQAFDEI